MHVVVLVLFAFSVGLIASLFISQKQYKKIMAGPGTSGEKAILYVLKEIRNMLAYGTMSATTIAGLVYFIGLLLGKF
jgi:uncharacterized protein YneF (UPF0154 family)